MHPTQGKIKAYLEVWYTNEAGLRVHLASLQICQSHQQEEIDMKIRAFEEKGIEALTAPTSAYIESFIQNEYPLSFEVKTIAG